MNILIKLTLFMGISFSFVNFAFAEENSSVKPFPKNSGYFSLEVGYGSLDTPSNDLPEEVSYSSGSVAGSLNIGFNHLVYRNINNLLLGAEVGYDYNGQSKYTVNSGDDSSSMEIVSSDFHLLGTATYLFANGINFFAKAGPALVKQELDFSTGDDSDQTKSNSKSQCQPMVAIGGGYQFKNLNFYLQYKHLFGKDAKDWDDLFNSDGTFTNIVSVDTYQAGMAVNIAI